MAEARALATVGQRFVDQTLARRVTADIGLKIERDTGSEQAGGDVVDDSVRYLGQTSNSRGLLLRAMAVFISIVVVVGRCVHCSAGR